MTQEFIENRIKELEKEAENLVGQGFAYTEKVCTIVGLQALLKSKFGK